MKKRNSIEEEDYIKIEFVEYDTQDKVQNTPLFSTQESIESETSYDIAVKRYSNNDIDDKISTNNIKGDSFYDHLDFPWISFNKLSKDRAFSTLRIQKIEGLIKGILSPSLAQNNIKLLGSKRAVEEEIAKLFDANFVIHPLSKFRLYWDLVIMGMLIVNLFVLPLDIAFFTDTDTWLNLHILSDTLCILDIAINFRTSYVGNTGSGFVLDEWEIIKHYLKTWFVVDLISSLPLHYVILEIYGKRNAFPLGIKSASHALKFIRLLKLLTILKLLRLSRVIRSFLQYEELYRITTSLMRYIKLISMMLIVAHWNGCLHFLIPMLQDFPTGCWVELCELEYEPWYTQYGWAIFKTLSHMLCIGYGRYIPILLSEALVTNFTMVTGATFYALFIASAMAHMLQNDNSKDLYVEKVKQIEEFLTHENVPDNIKDRVDIYMNQKYSKRRYFNENYLVSELSKPIKDDLMIHKYKDIIKKVEILRKGPPEFLSTVLSMISSDIFLEGDAIIKEGHKDSKIYIVQNGTLEISVNNDVVETLSDGAVFGEIGALKYAKQIYTVIANTTCHISYLSSKHLSILFRQHSNMKSLIERIAVKRLTLINKSCHFLKPDSETNVFKRSSTNHSSTMRNVKSTLKSLTRSKRKSYNYILDKPRSKRRNELGYIMKYFLERHRVSRYDCESRIDFI